MYWAGFMQASMLKEFTPEGQLKYQFIETVNQMRPYYLLRAIGGTLFLGGVFIMAYNLIKTIKGGKALDNEPAQALPMAKVEVVHADNGGRKEHWHRWIEKRPAQMMIWAFVAVLIGGAVEFIPTALVKSNVPTIASVKPYTPLELEGRDIYLREGCYTCHSQMIRPFRDEVARYGEYSKAGESIYDHPFQWGSKRTGPDLAREGGKYPDSWHFNHMFEPTSMSEGSVMPPYPWLIRKQINVKETPKKIRAMQKLGVPYPEGYDQLAVADMEKQAEGIRKTLAADKIEVKSDREIVALIAYLQRLGKDIKPTTAAAN
jgi:cytochrome c oxidase cbb3-type subunit I/II